MKLSGFFKHCLPKLVRCWLFQGFGPESDIKSGLFCVCCALPIHLIFHTYARPQTDPFGLVFAQEVHAPVRDTTPLQTASSSESSCVSDRLMKAGQLLPDFVTSWLLTRDKSQLEFEKDPGDQSASVWINVTFDSTHPSVQLHVQHTFVPAKMISAFPGTFSPVELFTGHSSQAIVLANIYTMYQTASHSFFLRNVFQEP